MFGKKIDLAPVHEALAVHTEDIQRINQRLAELEFKNTKMTAQLEVLESTIRAFLLQRIEYLTREGERMDRLGLVEATMRVNGIQKNRPPRVFNNEDRQ